MTIKSYQEYFRLLAMTHKDILHNPASESGDGEPGGRKFARWSADELITGLRTAVGFPALLLENYEIVTRASVVYDIKGTHSGAFTVLDHAEPSNAASEADAFERTERILWELLQQIWQDHYGPDHNRCITPFTDFYFDLNIIPVGPILNNEFGWRVEFNFKPKQVMQVTDAPAEGTFFKLLGDEDSVLAADDDTLLASQ